MNKILKWFLLTVDIIFLLIFVIPIFLVGIINAGNCAGIVLCVVCLIFIVRYSDIINFFKNLCKSIFGKVVTIALSGFIIFGIGMFFAASFLIVDAYNNPPSEETTVIVLGCKVNANGPSLMLLSRIETACDFLLKNPQSSCIVSGGKGSDEPISEARCMYDELVKRGIDKKRIYIENSSLNTEENIQYSYEIIQKENLCKKVTLITNNFHQRRASMHARNMGIRCYNVSAPTSVFLFPTYFLREAGGVVLELLQ